MERATRKAYENNLQNTTSRSGVIKFSVEYSTCIIILHNFIILTFFVYQTKNNGILDNIFTFVIHEL